MIQLEKKHLNKKHNVEFLCKAPRLKAFGYDTYPVIPILLIFIFVNYFQNNKKIESTYNDSDSIYLRSNLTINY